MALLMLFGFIAGAATAVSPCVLPILPIALSAGATGGRRRPLGIVVGLAVSFTFAIVALVYVISALGLPDDLLRKLAIFVLIAFGITLMIPPLAARLEAWLSRFAGRAGVAGRGGEGFWSGTAVGASLGLVYAPCAGPILAGVITVTASQPFTAGRLAVAFSYGIGSAVVLYFLMLGGRRVVAPLREARRRPAGGDGRGDGGGGAGDAPELRRALRERDRQRPAELSDHPHARAGGHGGGAQRACRSPRRSPPTASAEGRRARPRRRSMRAGHLRLPVLGKAPEFVDTQQWFNTPGERPLTMRGLRGRVVLIDFWTYSCINCLRTLPYLKAWDARYRRDGLTIVGVHTPEFPFEHEASNVAEAIERNGLRYPVVQDNDYGTWNAYGNQYWPAEYFVDAQGRGSLRRLRRRLLRQEGRSDPRAPRRSRPPGLGQGAGRPRRSPPRPG